MSTCIHKQPSLSKFTDPCLSNIWKINNHSSLRQCVYTIPQPFNVTYVDASGIGVKNSMTENLCFILLKRRQFQKRPTYPILHDKNITEYSTSALYIDILLNIDIKGKLKTQLHDIQDEFTFSIVYFPYMYFNSNILSSLAYSVCVS